MIYRHDWNLILMLDLLHSNHQLLIYSLLCRLSLLPSVGQ